MAASAYLQQHLNFLQDWTTKWHRKKTNRFKIKEIYCLLGKNSPLFLKSKVLVFNSATITWILPRSKGVHQNTVIHDRCTMVWNIRSKNMVTRFKKRLLFDFKWSLRCFLSGEALIPPFNRLLVFQFGTFILLIECISSGCYFIANKKKIDIKLSFI